MDHNLDELVRRVHERDPQALAELIDARRAMLLGFIDRHLGALLRRKVEPEDILQEVSGDAVRSLPEVDLADRDPIGWLCQLAERRIIDAHRKYVAAQKRSATREVSLAGGNDSGTSRPELIQMLAASMTTPSMALSRKSKEEQLQQALAQLPELQREAIRLRYVQGLGSKEIAQLLGKSDGAIRVMLTRSLDKLQQLLGVTPE